MMLAPNVFCLKCFAWIPIGDGRHNRIFSCDFDMFRETYFFELPIGARNKCTTVIKMLRFQRVN